MSEMISWWDNLKINMGMKQNIFRATPDYWPPSAQLIEEAVAAARRETTFPLGIATACAKRHHTTLLEWLKVNLAELHQLQAKTATGYEAARTGGPVEWSDPDWFRVVSDASPQASEKGHSGNYIFDLWNLSAYIESRKIIIARLEQGTLFDGMSVINNLRMN